MTFKAILFDVDGIIIKKREKLFSYRLAEELGIPIEEINIFFSNDFRECSFGRADLKERIEPYLVKWGWKKDVNKFLKYWFEIESTLNEEVLNKIKKIRTQGVKCYIATRQEKYRMKFLWEDLKLKKCFDGVFCSCDIGYDKSRPEFFQYVLNKLNIKPEEVIFFDDKDINIENAKKLGIQAYLYNNIETLKKYE